MHRRRWGFGLVLLTLASFIWITPFAPTLKWGSVYIQVWQPHLGLVTVEVSPKSDTWLDLDQVSKYTLSALILAEDSQFQTHHGVDFHATYESLKTNIEGRSYVRGGSTITQQVVRMAFLSREKTLLRKFREALGAFFVEMILTKNEIMAWYINLSHFGQNTVGLRSASLLYFQISPELLTLNQSILLAMTLPNPARWSREILSQRLSKKGRNKFAHILRQLYAARTITDQQREFALKTGDFGSPIYME